MASRKAYDASAYLSRLQMPLEVHSTMQDA